MGVHGLTTFVEGNRNYFTDLKLRDSLLVIDGCSLYFRLYFTSGLDQQKGGDYDMFADLVKQFFSALSACNVRPFVILDGGMDQTDKKFATLRQRIQSKILEAHNLSRGSHGCLLPLLTRDVFKQVLFEIGVPFVQCLSEADWEIASLAKQWGCPVLTNDSDFYIFDLNGGYLPFTFFQWTNLNGKASERYIPARCFTVKRFCSNFNHMSIRLLPLFAVIIGNDYTPARITSTFFSRVDLHHGGQNGSRHGKSNPRIQGLLLWLSQFRSPEEALEEVLEILEGRRQQESMRALLSAGMRDYHLPPSSSLAQFFSPGSPRLPDRQGFPTALSSQPAWLLWGAMSGKLPSLILDVLVLQRALLKAQVENSRLPSSHSTSLNIRKAIYSLLLQGGAGPRGAGCGQPDVAQVQRGRGRGRSRGGADALPQGQGGPRGGNASSPCSVEEYDRLDLSLKRTVVYSQQPDTVPRLHLSTLDQVPAPLRLQVLLGTLGVTEQALHGVPDQLSLPVCVVCFWMRSSKPKPTAVLLHALLLGLVYGELSQNPAPGMGSVLGRLEKFRTRPGERRGMDLGVAHSLSQWQSCMSAGLYLNQLLCLPLLEPQCARLFCGTLLHGLVACLKGGCPVESLLVSAPLAGQLYSTLLGAVITSTGQSSGPLASSSAKNNRGGAQKRGRQANQRGRGNAGRGRGHRGGRGASSTDDLDNRFALLMCGED